MLYYANFFIYSLQHSETFDVSHVVLPLTIAELSMLKQVLDFLAHPVFTACNYEEIGCLN